MPDGSPVDAPGAVLYFSAEDDPADTLVPRLEVAGGDLALVNFVTVARFRPAGMSAVVERLPTFRDVDLVARTIASTQARLVIFDPFMAYLEAGANAFRDQDVRGVLAPLAHLAERTHAAFLFIRHLNKGGGGRALYRGGGSIGIVGAMRSGLLVAHDPSDPERQVLASTKNNLGPLPGSLGFTGEKRDDVGAVKWLGPVPYSADLLLANSDGEGNRGEQMEAAIAFLQTELADGPVPSATIHARARAADIKPMTLQRARALLGIESDKDGHPATRHWAMHMPEASSTSETTSEQDIHPRE